MIEACEIPADALLQKFRVAGTFADCYTTTLRGRVPLTSFVEAFYTTPLFKLERFILAVVGVPSTDEHARQLARGERDAFAAWTVEARAADELLLCDVLGRTRSWLKAAPADSTRTATRLHFGSAVVPKRNTNSGKPELGAGFNALLGFHKHYSIALLRAARRALSKQVDAIAGF